MRIAARSYKEGSGQRAQHETNVLKPAVLQNRPRAAFSSAAFGHNQPTNQSINQHRRLELGSLRRGESQARNLERTLVGEAEAEAEAEAQAQTQEQTEEAEQTARKRERQKHSESVRARARERWSPPEKERQK